MATRPTVVPQLPYQDVSAALAFLERAFGFREIVSRRYFDASGVVGHGTVEVGDSMIGIGTQGAHGAISPQKGGVESQYVSVLVDDLDAHYQRAVAAGARIADEMHVEPPMRAYEAFDPEGHRWRFVQWLPTGSTAA